MSDDTVVATSGDGLIRARRVDDHIRIETRSPKPNQPSYPWTPWRHRLMVPQDRPTTPEVL